MPTRSGQRVPPSLPPKKEPHDGTHHAALKLPLNRFDFYLPWLAVVLTKAADFFLSLHQPHRGKCWLIDSPCDRQSVISLVGCDGFPGHRPKDPIDRSIVVTGGCQRFLDIDGHLVRRQSVVAVAGAIVNITHGRRITPGREPVAGVPVPPAAIHEDDPGVVASPPT